jgi:hypothetical protein
VAPARPGEQRIDGFFKRISVEEYAAQRQRENDRWEEEKQELNDRG